MSTDSPATSDAIPLTAAAKPHVAVLFYRLGPYHFARVKAAAAAGLQVTAVEFSNVDPTYAWDPVVGEEGFSRVRLFSGVPVEAQSAGKIVAAVEAALDRLRPLVVAVPGWSDRCSLAALNWCVSRGVPAILMSESTAWDDQRKPWREFIKRRVVGLCASGLAGGTSHADYLAQLGMPRARIFLGYDAVDNEHFDAKAAEARSQKSEVRSQHRLPERYFLASARFVEKKNLVRLIQAYARYRQIAIETASSLSSSTEDLSCLGGNERNSPQAKVPQGPSERARASHWAGVRSRPMASRSTTETLSSNSAFRIPHSAIWPLILLGDGPLKADLCRLISHLGLADFVHLPGFKQYDELPTYYGLASAFVHASTTEQWGLVVNEAMASSLPVLVSNRCGCAHDLVQEGINGFTFDPTDTDQLAQLMLKISAFNFPLSDFCVAGRQIISQWGPERFADGLSRAVDAALAAPVRRASFLDQLLLRLLLMRGNT